MSINERKQRYAEALGWRLDDETPGAIRAMLDEQVQRIMAVADAEQAQLRAEIERLREINHELVETHNANIGHADELRGRAMAAERALADERATVARALADDAITAALDSVDWFRIGEGREASPREAAAAALVAFRAALAGPVETTERPHPKCNDDLCAGKPPCLGCALSDEATA